MDTFLVDVCEVCGTVTPQGATSEFRGAPAQAADHAGWYAVAGNGPTMEILPWSEEVRGRTDCRAACCGDHVQKLVFSAATRGLATPTLAVEPRHGGWNPDALLPASQQERDGGDDPLVTLLSAVESILQTRSADDEEGEDDGTSTGFDA